MNFTFVVFIKNLPEVWHPDRCLKLCEIYMFGKTLLLPAFLAISQRQNERVSAAAECVRLREDGHMKLAGAQQSPYLEPLLTALRHVPFPRGVSRGGNRGLNIGRGLCTCCYERKHMKPGLQSWKNSKISRSKISIFITCCWNWSTSIVVAHA